MMPSPSDDLRIEATVDGTAASDDATLILRPLVARPEEAELCMRAEALREQLAPHAGSERLDPYFFLAIADLAGAIRCLEGLRARGVAPDAAERALEPLAGLLRGCERAVEAALSQLEAERRVRPSRSRPKSNRRSRPTSGPS
jgi:hypothetical protein